MHSVAGKNPLSLEQALPGLHAEPLLLCNRLDFETSGIVTAALDTAGLLAWRDAEDAGLCEKRYVALLCRHLPAPLTISRALDTNKRVTTKVLKTDAPPLRHTLLTPLACINAADLLAPDALDEPLLHPTLRALAGADPRTPLTLTGCRIHKGARHQIRAHAAHAGHPLWGDVRYGGGEYGGFFLHHGGIELPGATAHCIPPWFAVLPRLLGDAALSWLAHP